MTASQDRPNRRSILAAGAAAVMPAIWTSRARAAQDVFVRTPGGAYDELRAELVYKPFFRETGIRVVPVASNAGKLVAMFKAGRPDICTAIRTSGSTSSRANTSSRSAMSDTCWGPATPRTGRATCRIAGSM